jgi:phosphohistidine swiveling domain-containing protein
MNQDLLNKISKTTWQLYLSRPFDLFQTSVWNRWYDSQEIYDLFGIRLTKGLFVEYPKGMVTHFRDDKDMNSMYAAIRNIAENDSSLSNTLLDNGLEQNEKVKDLILNETEMNLDEALKLCIEVVLVGTIFPLFAGEVFLKKYGEKELITQKALALRAESYYPKIFSELLIPAANRILMKDQISPEFLPYILIDEFKSGISSDVIKQRQIFSKEDKKFIYYSDSVSKYVVYEYDSSEYLRKIDNSLVENKQEIKGTIANAGRVKGRVRLVQTNDISKIMFNDGEILVATSTNPILVPIIQKSSAVITDEGGALCHAAIVSRELKKPCIIGTKIATKVLKDGDMVEVDADKGIVKII